MIDFKKINPKTIWVIPLYNAVKRNVDLAEQIKEFNVIKVTQKMIVTDNAFVGKFYIDGRLNRHNYGYLPFLTKQDALNHLEREQIIRKIKYNYDLKRLTYEELKMIQVLLEKEIK